MKTEEKRKETENLLLDFARDRFNSSEIFKILNAKKKDQLSMMYGAKMEELIPYADITGKSYSIVEYTKLIDNYVRKLAYRDTDWGRKQNIHKGDYVVPLKKSARSYFPISMRIEDVRKGKFTSHEYYADYSFWFDTDNIYKVFYSFDDRIESFNFLDLWKDREFIGHNKLNPSISSIWGEKLPAYEYKGYEYHIDFKDTNKLYEEDIYNKLRNRHLNKLEREIKAEDIADKVYVNMEDSLEAGNCRAGTLAFMRNFNIKKDDKIRGDKVLNLKTDSFTRRAVISAYLKTV